MRSSVKLGKHGEDRGIVDSLDRISSLPDELLGQILSFLETRCAVSTSVLSTRWRYLFTLTNCLSFSFDDAPCVLGSEVNKETEADRRRRFRDFVYKVMELHQTSPIKKFSLVCGDPCYELDLYTWVSNAVLKGVQELHCDFRGQYSLPNSLFVCESLVKLKIIGGSGDYELELVPFSTCLPNLKVLHLEYVRFPDQEAVESLFSGCELLEDLTLMFCGCDTRCDFKLSSELLKVVTIEDCSFDDGLFEIDAPNLSYLTYSSNTDVKIAPSWKDSCSLVKAELSFNCCADEDLNHNSHKYDRRLIKGAARKATNISLLSDSVELLLTLDEDEQMPNFDSLSRLRLGYCPFDAWKNVTSLLDKAPQLETVIFEWGLHRCYCDPVSPPNVDVSAFSCHAKVIVVNSFCSHEYALLLLRHLLRNARALTRLIVNKCNSVNTEEVQRISKELMMLPRASADCCIEIN